MKKDNRENKEKVTVIVPTYNSARTLAVCLKSIAHQTYPFIEIIIVDNYSEDKTIQIARKFKTKILRHKSERSKAKNLGAREAQGRFLLFLDSDMELSPNVIKECVSACRKSRVDAVVIPEEPFGESFLAFYRKIGKNFLRQETCFELPRFFKKRTFLRLEGFDETLTCGEDFDLYQRYREHGYRTTKIKSLIKHHETDLSLTKMVIKAHHYGRTLPFLISKKPLKTLERYAAFQKNQLKNLRWEKIKPAQLLGFFTLRLIEIIAYLTGLFVGTIFFTQKR
jgi:glycosyltransferase involved in cell wall biosynthesis